jgi:outer membrane protein insertion porin family
VPLFERFFLGGPNSIRSFKAQQVSPVDSSGTAIGGNIELLGNIEYTVPLFFGVRAAAFVDVGNVWGPDIAGGQKFDITVMHYAVGAGLRWLSPFGPIRIDYGINLNPNTKPPAKQDFGNFQFSVGSAF